MNLVLSGAVNGQGTNGQPTCVLQAGGLTWDISVTFDLPELQVIATTEWTVENYRGPMTYSTPNNQVLVSYSDGKHNFHGGGPASVVIGDGGLSATVDAVVAGGGSSLHLVGTMRCASLTTSSSTGS